MNKRLRLREIFISHLLVLTCTCSFGQLLESDKDLQEQFIENIKRDYKGEVTASSKAVEKDVLEFYERRANYLEYIAEEDHIIFESKYSAYLNRLKDEIADQNPQFAEEIGGLEVYLTRYYWPNAFAIGENTIAFNLGLVRFFENENQLVWILGHEIAHHLLDHYENRVRRVAELLHSKELKQDVKSAQRQQDRPNEKVKDVILSNQYSQRAHARGDESQADSLGLRLYLNTKRHRGDAKGTIMLLDRLEDYYDSSYVDVFGKLGVKRLEVPKSGFTIYDEDYLDARDEKLKTHPDCDVRREQISIYCKEWDEARDAINRFKSIEFEELKSNVDMYLIDSYQFFKRFDRATLMCLRKAEEDKDNQYYIDQIAWMYYQVVKARGEYRVNSYIAVPHENVDSVYSELLTAFHKTRLTTLRKAAFNYMRSNFDADKASERFYTAYIESAKLTDDEALYNGLKKQYQEKFNKPFTINNN